MRSRSTPNGISQSDYARLGCGAYRSDDGLLIALTEPSDGQMRQAVADGAWILVIERDKSRFATRAGRLQAPHLARVLNYVQNGAIQEFHTWRRDPHWIGRDRYNDYDNDLVTLTELAEALDAAWLQYARDEIRRLWHVYGRETIPANEQLPVWLHRGWDAACAPMLIDTLCAE